MGCPVITTYSENKAATQEESPGWEVAGAEQSRAGQYQSFLPFSAQLPAFLRHKLESQHRDRLS